MLWSIIRSITVTRQTVLMLDKRMTLPSNNISQNIQIKRVIPSILHRLSAEIWLFRNVQPQDVVLCFGNLPPLLKLRGRVVVFMQNRYLVDPIRLVGFSLKAKLRLAVERWWLSSRMANADEFIVQTPTMRRLLVKLTEKKVPVQVLPFVDLPNDYVRSARQYESGRETDFDFLYVASGEPHKNHRRLLEAWSLLAKEGLFPTLCLTLNTDHFPMLCSEIDVLCQRSGVRVTNVGELSQGEVLALYKRAGALVFPSTFESFGLPLIEARLAGLPVLSSELDYVRDIIDPEQAFDPESPISIARAVKRYIGKSECTLPLQQAKDFIEHVTRIHERYDEIQ